MILVMIKATKMVMVVNILRKRAVTTMSENYDSKVGKKEVDTLTIIRSALDR